MLQDVIYVEPLKPYRLFVRFEDGLEGEIALDQIVSLEGFFKALRDPVEFAKARVHPELGVVCWPNGADLDSDVLYAHLTRSSIQIDTSA